MSICAYVFLSFAKMSLFVVLYCPLRVSKIKCQNNLGVGYHLIVYDSQLVVQTDIQTYRGTGSRTDRQISVRLYVNVLVLKVITTKQTKFIVSAFALFDCLFRSLFGLLFFFFFLKVLILYLILYYLIELNSI